MAKKTQFTSANQPENRGRKKGSKNRSTEEIRSFIQKVVDNNLTNLEQDLERMNPTNRWVILDKLTKYFLPALSKNDNNNVNSGEIEIKVTYSDKLGNQETKE